MPRKINKRKKVQKARHALEKKPSHRPSARLSDDHDVPDRNAQMAMIAGALSLVLKEESR